MTGTIFGSVKKESKKKTEGPTDPDFLFYIIPYLQNCDHLPVLSLLVMGHSSVPDYANQLAVHLEDSVAWGQRFFPTSHLLSTVEHKSG